MQTHMDETHVPAHVDCRCSFCTSAEESPADVRTHFRETHLHETEIVSESVRCTECGWADAESRNMGLVTHYAETHSVTDLFESDAGEQIGRTAGVCPVCEDELANEKGMIQHVVAKHMDVARPSRTYTCTVCDDQLETVSEVRTHFGDQHPDVSVPVPMVEWVCPECSVSWESEESVRGHYVASHCSWRYACPECSETTVGEEMLHRHYWASHTDRPVFVSEEVAEVSRETCLECLYNINKHAKRYAELGTKNYRQGKKTTAKANSVKKNALYLVKEEVLGRLYPDADEIRKHRIHGSDFYLVDFGTYSYHTPIDSLDIPSDMVSGEVVELEGFESDSEKTHSGKSLKECLLFFEDAFGLNTNKYLSRQYLSYGGTRHFIGWSYLGEDTDPES